MSTTTTTSKDKSAASTLPTVPPSAMSTSQPTVSPSAISTSQPTVSPSALSTSQPTVSPSALSTAQPTPLPTTNPSTFPTPVPSSNMLMTLIVQFHVDHISKDTFCESSILINAFRFALSNVLNADMNYITILSYDATKITSSSSKTQNDDNNNSFVISIQETSSYDINAIQDIIAIRKNQLKEKFVQTAKSNGYEESVEITNILIDPVRVIHIPPTTIPTITPTPIPTFLPSTYHPTSIPTTLISSDEKTILEFTFHWIGIITIMIIITIYCLKRLCYPSRNRRHILEEGDPTFFMFRRHASTFYSSIEHDNNDSSMNDEHYYDIRNTAVADVAGKRDEIGVGRNTDNFASSSDPPTSSNIESWFFYF